MKRLCTQVMKLYIFNSKLNMEDIENIKSYVQDVLSYIQLSIS